MKNLISLLLMFCSISNIAFASCVEDEWTKVKSGYVAAASKEVLDKVSQIATSGDNEAFKKLELEGLLTGTIKMTDEGMEVYIVKIHPWAERAEVRFRGDTDIWWIQLGALECNK